MKNFTRVTTHTHTHSFSLLRISLFTFLMLLVMSVSAQNYGNISPSGGSGNISLGSAVINPNTRFNINTNNQNGAEIIATGAYKKGLILFTSGYASTALSVQATHPMSNAASFSGGVTFADKVGIGTSILYLPSHEKLAIRNGMVTTDGIGNGISLKGSYYGTDNDFGTQNYGLFMGDGNLLNLSTVQTTAYNPVVLSSFYGLGFNVGLGKMALCQNGTLYIGSRFSNTVSKIGIVAAKDPNNLEYRLYVEEGIRTEKVKVDLVGTWADYVFEPTYDLIPLKEVEKFITTNKHLPNVPSAKEVKAEGIDVAEMNEVLLRKIEELMLYTIEQQKNIEKLQEQVGILESKKNN
jgi:hypothetical protein